MSSNTLFGNVPDDWTVSTIGDIATLQQGLQIAKELRVNSSKEGYIPLLKITDLPSRTFSEFVTDIKTQHIANDEDIIYTRTGQVGFVYTNVSGCVHNNCFKVNVDYSKFDKIFIYYYLKSDKFYEYSNQVASGSVQKDLKHSAFKSCPIGYPSLLEQKAIADTLCCLDDKIELNNRINKTLEEMAQAIFKSWFVDFEPFQDGEFEDSELGRIPKGWRVGTLRDISNITMGQSPNGSSYNENNDGTVFYQGRTDFGKRYPTIRLYTTEPKRIAKKGDILLSVRAPVGDINVASEDCCIGRGLASLKSKNNCNSYLFYQLLNLKDGFNVYNGEGTVFGSVNKDTLHNMQVLIPSESAMSQFQKSVGKLDDIIENNFIQIRSLAAIRDSLLPKLMSGEIRVPIEEVQ